MPATLLELCDIQKSFPGVRALRGVSLSVERGEILGLVGENGAGKSTLIKLLSGVHVPDSGVMRWKGEATEIPSPREAQELGIATIHQELAYCAHLSVAENLLLGEPWPRSFWGGVAWNELDRCARDLLQRFDIDLAPDRPFQDLSTAEKQEVAIARAMAKRSSLLILDEPTASLTDLEVARLFGRLRKLREDGTSVLYISHRLDEIVELCDRVATLRDGSLVSIRAEGDIEVRGLVTDMVGREMVDSGKDSERLEPGDVALSLEAVSRAGQFEEIDLEVREGEIVGLAGLLGSGRSEVARAVIGL
ncbi:MAG: sugar ABC transporter ATP-binding protein, partial [Planctomycetota bacterium]